MDPVFLTLFEVLQIHQFQIARFGGETGIRSIELLKSALGMPMATYQGIYLYTDLHEMAAAYLFHLTQNHPFVDGNKRTGTSSAVVFLGMNGQELDASPEDLTGLALGVAEGSASRAEVAMFLRKHTRPE